MSKLKIACLVIGMIMFLGIIFSTLFKSSSSQDEWESVNSKMANTLQSQSSVDTEQSANPTEHSVEIPKQQVGSTTQAQAAAPTKSQTESQPQQPQTQTIEETNEPQPSNGININSATLEQLDVLPGIGPSKAKAIIDYRTKYGDFRSLEQLMEVKGIGPKIFAKMKENITIAASN